MNREIAVVCEGTFSKAVLRRIARIQGGSLCRQAAQLPRQERQGQKALLFQAIKNACPQASVFSDMTQ